jgi:ribosomal protein L11 methyltransferase
VADNESVYSLELKCKPEEADLLSAELWEMETVGIRETEIVGQTHLIAAFETNGSRERLIATFAAYSPRWRQEDATDWVKRTEEAWPPRLVGARFFLCAPWRGEPTPEGRIRLTHNPGLACGTGEHPCTQLAIEALEGEVREGDRVADVGAGSGVLAIAALQLGANRAVCVDLDEAAMAAARENSGLNQFHVNRSAPLLAVGSAEAIATNWADVTVANISGTVLLTIFDELERVTALGGKMILTGFSEAELRPIRGLFAGARVVASGEWRCVIGRNEAGR